MGTRGRSQHVLRKLPGTSKISDQLGPGNLPRMPEQILGGAGNTRGESRGWRRTWSKARFKLSHLLRMHRGRQPGCTVLATAGVGWQDIHAPELLLKV